MGQPSTGTTGQEGGDPTAERWDFAHRLLERRLIEPAELLARRGGPERIGRYEVLGLIGEGASSVVYRVRDPEIGRVAAAKLLKGATERTIDRFRREMRVLASFEHPNLVRILDAGTHEGQPFFVMDFVGEKTLAGVEPSVVEAVDLIAQVARGCHAAHEQGVIHHDLKPSNIIAGERPVVVDFGVAKVLDAAGPTQPGSIVGTPAYMSPEQLDGRREDRRSDVYALGVILYELVTGQHPFEREGTRETLLAIAGGECPAPRELVPTLSRRLEAIVLRALAYDPDERYPTAEALAEALEGWRESGSPPRWAAGVAAVAGLLVLCGGIWVATRGGTPSVAASTSPSTSTSTSTSESLGGPVVESWLARLDDWERRGGAPIAYADYAEVRTAAERLEAIGGDDSLPLDLRRRAHLGAARGWVILGQGKRAVGELQAAQGLAGPAGPAGPAGLATFRRLELTLRWEGWLETVAGGGPRVAKDLRERLLKALEQPGETLQERRVNGALARVVNGAQDPPFGLAEAPGLVRAQALLVIRQLDDARSALDAALPAQRASASRTRALIELGVDADQASPQELAAAFAAVCESLTLNPADEGTCRVTLAILARLLPNARLLLQQFREADSLTAAMRTAREDFPSSHLVQLTHGVLLGFLGARLAHDGAAAGEVLAEASEALDRAAALGGSQAEIHMTRALIHTSRARLLQQRGSDAAGENAASARELERARDAGAKQDVLRSVKRLVALLQGKRQ